jgi:hypothetical protein
MKCLALLPFAAILALPANAQQGAAQLTPEKRAERFATGDKNKNGQLEKAEWLAILPERAKPRAEMIWGRIDPEGKAFLAANGRLGGPPVN